MTAFIGRQNRWIQQKDNQKVEWPALDFAASAASWAEHGNAIGHVSTISAETDEPPKDTKAKANTEAPGTLIVFHEAVSAREVLALIQPPK